VSVRRLYLDDAPGEARGVVTLDGRPERLLIRRIDGSPRQMLGARLIARVRRVEAGLASAFLDVGEEPDAVLATTGAAASLVEGAAIEVEITVEPRRGKGAVVAFIGPAEGSPRLMRAAPGLADRLSSFAPAVEIVRGEPAREAADIAEAAAIAVEHALPGGGLIAIEPTRALTAVDVDLQAGAGDARRGARRVNLAAIEHAARLLRLKALGGLIVIDLIGAGHDGAALAAAAKAAFAADQPGVSIGPVSRFGLLQLVTPRRERPVAETLCNERGEMSPTTIALRLMRALQREALADGGARLESRCAPSVAAAAAPYMEALRERIGARFEVCASEAMAPDRFEVSVR
jgi:Ribonuclease G/E